MKHLTPNFLLAPLVSLVIGVSVALAQSTAFTYQGKLTDGGNPASGTYDLSFKLFNILSGGSQIGTEQIEDDVNVSGGIFTVTLDFGSSPFTSSTGNFLEIAVRPGVSTGSFTLLSPRQPITSSPYSVQTLRAQSAAVADNANALGGVAAGQYVQTNDPRLSDARSPLAGSANYVQNSSVQQPLSNFNISGNGTANIFDAATQFNIGGSRILSNAGSNNLFAGVEAGDVNTGSVNAFFGATAGRANTTASENAFFGFGAGSNNQTGCCNSFFGRSSGSSNTSGFYNSFVGSSSGFANTTGSSNSFFGILAGDTNTTGGFNTIIGANADVATNNLSYATAVGAGALVSTSDTVVLGREGDTVRVPGSMNVAGTITGTITNSLEAFNASNLGGVAASQFVQTTDPRLADARNPLAGSANYIQNGTGVQPSSNFNINGNGRVAGNFTANGISTSFIDSPGFLIIGSSAASTSVDINKPATINSSLTVNGIMTGNGSGSFTGSLSAGTQFNINGSRILSVAGTSNFFAGLGAGQLNSGVSNTFVGTSAGNLNTTGSSNTFIGAGSNSSAGDLTNATAIGSGAIVSQSNSLVLGNNANVGVGTGSPAHRLHVVGNVFFTGIVRAPGGIFVANPNTLIITSPNGACWGITVNNAGVIGAFSTACP